MNCQILVIGGMDDRGPKRINHLEQNPHLLVLKGQTNNLPNFLRPGREEGESEVTMVR